MEIKDKDARLKWKEMLFRKDAPEMIPSRFPLMERLSSYN